MIFLEKRIKFQILNPKVLSVANSCDYNEIPKMAKIVYRQMPAPRDLFPKIPATGQKLGCKSPRVGENFRCKSPGVRRGDGYGKN